MKKIVIITSYLSGNGGIEKVIQRMNYVLPKKNYSLRVLSLTGGNKVSKIDEKNIAMTGEEKWLDEIKNDRFPMGSRFRVINFIMHAIFCTVFLLRYRPEIVICTGPSQPVFLRKIRSIFFLKYKLFIWPHFSLSSGFGNFNNIKKADKLLAISKGIIEQAVSIGMDRKKIEYFPNPFENVKDKITLHKNEKKNHVRFGYVGRLVYLGQKRIKDLIDATSMVEGDFEVIIAGDGEDYNLINNYTKEKGLTDKVKILKGWHSEPWDKIGEIDALILTSQFEGLPTVIGEAMSRGISCISSNCETGPADFITNGINGFLYQVEDVKELSRLMQLYVDNLVCFDSASVNSSIRDLYDETYLERVRNIIN